MQSYSGRGTENDGHIILPTLPPPYEICFFNIQTSERFNIVCVLGKLVLLAVANPISILMQLLFISIFCAFCIFKLLHRSPVPLRGRHAHKHQRDTEGEEPEAVSPQPALPGPESDSSDQPQPLPVRASEPGAQTRS